MVDCFSFSFFSFYLYCCVPYYSWNGFQQSRRSCQTPKLENGKNIFLLKTAWGNDERIAIGLDDKLKGGFGNVILENLTQTIRSHFSIN